MKLGASSHAAGSAAGAVGGLRATQGRLQGMVGGWEVKKQGQGGASPKGQVWIWIYTWIALYQGKSAGTPSNVEASCKMSLKPNQRFTWFSHILAWPTYADLSSHMLKIKWIETCFYNQELWLKNGTFFVSRYGPNFMGHLKDVGTWGLQTGEFRGIRVPAMLLCPNVRDTPQGKFDWNHDNQPWGDMRCPISSHTCYILLQYVWGGHYPAIFALDFKLILGYTDRNQRPPQSVLSTPGDPSRPWNFHRFFCMGIQSPQFCDPSNNEGLIKNHKVSQSSRSPTRPLPRAHQPSMKYYWWVIFGRLNPIVSSDSWWLITSVV
jgi:hypothetical protein